VSSSAESELVARCRRGDALAWDELFDTHYAAVGRYIFQLSPALTREDADEIAQETFLSVIKHIGNFHGDSQLQTWLFRIAGNKARDYLEKQRAAKRGGGHAPLSLHAEDPETGRTLDAPSRAPGPDGALLAAERAQILGQALAELGGPCQEIIELRYFADLSYEEISRALRLNEKTVSSRLSKCLDKLEEIARPLLGAGKTPSAPSNPPSSP
jgi:RNA polymerase sigma-70 factor (ECF subfamily)